MDTEDNSGWQTVHYNRVKKHTNERRERERDQKEALPERQAADGQDWGRVVLGKKKTSTQPRPKGATSVGGQIRQAVKDATGESTGRLRKLEEQGHAGRKRQLDEASLKAVKDARFGNGYTQDEVNRMCQFPVNMIRDIEAGVYCPNPKQLNMLSSVLKVVLRYAH